MKMGKLELKQHTKELLKDIDLEITGIIPKGYNYNTVAKIFEDIAIEVELWN